MAKINHYFAFCELKSPTVFRGIVCLLPVSCEWLQAGGYLTIMGFWYGLYKKLHSGIGEMRQELLDTKEPLRAALKRFCIVVVFSIAFGYIEAAVVVYLWAIFSPDGFTFPLVDFGIGALWKRLLLTEVGREAASMVLIFTAAWSFGRNFRQRFAYFTTIFAVWDIFYYIWLKVLIDWPKSIMDWDILFLIPMVWAAPVAAPVLVSLTLLIFAVLILYRDCCGRAIKVTPVDWLGFAVSGIIVVGSFCYAGLYIAQPDFRSYFYWPVFGLGEALAIGLFVKCLLRSK